MNCPKCSTQLLMTDRQGVEIDYCPSCRGVWLDRGELDKIVERSASYAPEVQSRERYSEPIRRRDDDDDDYKRRDEYKHKRRKGFLGEIFDF